jgi:mRNA interferase YafQ
MLIPVYTSRFSKDVKKISRSGVNMDDFKTVTRKLINEESLEEKYRDHLLIGNYKGRRECHIKPDWLLIYVIQDGKITFERTGSHSELFK